MANKSKIVILIVDDEQVILDSIEKHLRHEDDLQILSALSVSEALDIMQSNKVDIILTDLMMPETDGLEFLNIIQNHDKNIKTIMITGYATINTAMQAIRSGAFDYIAKPFTRKQLKEVVRRAADLVILSRKDANPKASTTSMGNNIAGNEITGNEISDEQINKTVGDYSWFALEEDGTVTIGIERAVLYSIGAIQTVYLPSVGDLVRQGSVYFQLFSAGLQTQSLQSPLSGEVVRVNEKVAADPQGALQDPYGEGWLIKIKPENFEDEIKLIGR